jgi:hypothetical protein
MEMESTKTTEAPTWITTVREAGGFAKKASLSMSAIIASCSGEGEEGGEGVEFTDAILEDLRGQGLQERRE